MSTRESLKQFVRVTTRPGRYGTKKDLDNLYRKQKAAAAAREKTKI